MTNFIVSITCADGKNHDIFVDDNVTKTFAYIKELVDIADTDLLEKIIINQTEYYLLKIFVPILHKYVSAIFSHGPNGSTIPVIFLLQAYNFFLFNDDVALLKSLGQHTDDLIYNDIYNVEVQDLVKIMEKDLAAKNLFCKLLISACIVFNTKTLDFDDLDDDFNDSIVPFYLYVSKNTFWKENVQVFGYYKFSAKLIYNADLPIYTRKGVFNFDDFVDSNIIRCERNPTNKKKNIKAVHLTPNTRATIGINWFDNEIAHNIIIDKPVWIALESVLYVIDDYTEELDGDTMKPKKITVKNKTVYGSKFSIWILKISNNAEI